ncbi:lysophospholipid acyltransferase 7 [Atheta coriaria]|uniref:lysophospholipid acyltransferase 7 n=1 Tax=Dalotia coriaria TaxID=877792 RepID=UPI0031F3AD56
MDFQDIVYLSLLIFSVIFGHFYRQIEDLQQRKRIGTIIGILIVLVVSGFHIIHNLVFFLINAAIILYWDKRQCHLVSIVFSFAYLLFFRTTEYFGIPYPPSHTNLVQMMLTLRIVAVAFDLNTAFTNKKKKEKGDCSEEERAEIDYDDFSVDVFELFHYSFNYIGVLTGPFIKYRTFRDYYSKPFSKYAPYKQALLGKLQWVPLYAVLHLLATYYYPFSYAKTDEFFFERSVFYRLMYIWPVFFAFRMRLFIGFALSECACIMAGLGAYPAITEPKSGGGPSKNFKTLLELSKNTKQCATTEMNFVAVDAVDVWGTEFEPTFKGGMRAWNTGVQYWLALCIYKRCPYKKYRAFITMGISAMWHGICIGHYICLGCAPFVLPIDAVWTKILLKDRTGTVRYINEWIMLVISRFFFSYLAIAFYYLNVDWVMYYYNSIYHMGIIIGLVMYFGGLQILRFMGPKRDSGAVKTVPTERTKAD